MQEALEIDLSSPAFLADPFPTYALMRREAPVYPRYLADAPTMWTRGTTWYVAGYDDVLTVLRDPRTYVKDYRLAFTAAEVAAMPPQPRVIRLASENIINLEAPEHTRLRRLVSKAFSPAIIDALQPRVAAITTAILDRAQDAGRMELMSALAFPLPITVITELLGLPSADGDQLRAWAPLAPPRDEQELAAVESGIRALVDYLRHHLDERQRQPREDLLTALLAAEVDGERLSEDALCSMIILLLTAGFETTVNFLGNAALELLRHPAELARVRREPALWPSAVEELLRFAPPIHTSTVRWAAIDVELRGQQIRRGDQVMAVIASANRDPSRFTDPERLDLGRRDNRHLAFGFGVHFCLGAALARLESRIALAALVERFPGLRLAIDPAAVRWRDLPPFRGPEALPLVWD